MRVFGLFRKMPVEAFLKPTPGLWGMDEPEGVSLNSDNKTLPALKDKIRRMLLLANATASGAALTRVAVGAKTIIELDPRRPARSAVIIGAPSVISLSAKDREDMLANMYAHEESHDLQLSSIKKKLGHRNAFERKTVTLADKAMVPLIMEGVAFAEQTINAYELLSLGVSGPWTWLSFNFRFQPLVETLLQNLERHPLDSDAMRCALFEAWMTQSVSRLSYDLDHLKYAYIHYGRFESQPVVSFSNEKLWCIADRPDGNSYLKGVDVKVAPYLGVWGEVSTREEVKEAAVLLGRKEAFFNAYGNAAEIVEVLEDHLECRGRWTHLPADYSPAQIMRDDCLMQFGKAARRACCALQVAHDVPEARVWVHDLLDRAQRFADKHTNLPVFAAAVSDGWQAFRSLTGGIAPQRQPGVPEPI